MEHHYCAIHKDIGLRPIHESDIEYLRIWRNNRELSKFLSPVQEITPEMQMNWFHSYQQDQNILFFAIIDYKENRTIGSVALYDFKDNVCEIGKIVIGDSSKRGQGIGYRSLLMAMYIGMKKLGIDRFFLHVCEDNVAAYHLYVKTGFHQIERRKFIKGGMEICMFITNSEFIQNIQNNTVLDEIKIYEEGK